MGKQKKPKPVGCPYGCKKRFYTALGMSMHMKKCGKRSRKGGAKFHKRPKDDE